MAMIDNEDLVVQKCTSAEASLQSANGPQFDMVLVNAVVKTAFATLKQSILSWYPHLTEADAAT